MDLREIAFILLLSVSISSTVCYFLTAYKLKKSWKLNRELLDAGKEINRENERLRKIMDAKKGNK